MPSQVAELYEQCRALNPTFALEVMEGRESFGRKSLLLAWRVSEEGIELAGAIAIGFKNEPPWLPACLLQARYLLQSAIDHIRTYRESSRREHASA